MDDPLRARWLLRALMTWRVLDVCGYLAPLLRVWVTWVRQGR